MLENQVLVRTKRRRQLQVCQQADDLAKLLGELTGDVCEHRIVSFCRISPAGFLRWVADQTYIRRLSLSTFRVGPRALRLLSELHGQGQLGEARFVLGRLVASRHRRNNELDYWERLLSLCETFGWQACSIANHTKVALFDTDAGKFVLEGSANLNEAPNWEQYCFQRDDELFDFYDQVFDQMFAFAASAADQSVLPDEEDEDEEEGLGWPEDDRPLLW